MLRKTKQIFVILGDDCNMACRYCIQHPIVRTQKKAELNPDLLRWIDDTAALTDDMLSICFFGGEPLLYYDTIRKMVGYHKAKNVQYHMITNGRALTREMVDFLNSHNVGLNVSWDGNGTVTRGYDVFEHNRDNILALNCLSLNSVISSKSYPYDILKAMQSIDDEYYAVHHNHIGVHTDYIFGCNLPDPSLENIDYGKLDEQMDAILEEYDRYVRGGDVGHCLAEWMTGQLQTYLWSMEHPGIDPYCQNGRDILNVDPQGNLYYCHNTREIIGSIYSNTDRYLARVDALESGIDRQREVCRGCKAYPLCRMCCKLIPPDQMEDHYCKLRRFIFTKIIHYIETNLAQYAKEGV